MGDYRRQPGRRPPRRRRCPRGTREYRIRRQDTLYSIARRYNTSVRELRRLNPGLDPDRLRVGRIICVPDNRYDRPCP
ncbi:LysM peptidoglycan-binding domain-containing protein [Halanaerobaculum tunisiense]